MVELLLTSFDAHIADTQSLVAEAVISQVLPLPERVAFANESLLHLKMNFLRSLIQYFTSASAQILTCQKSKITTPLETAVRDTSDKLMVFQLRSLIRNKIQKIQQSLQISYHTIKVDELKHQENLMTQLNQSILNMDNDLGILPLGPDYYSTNSASEQGFSTVRKNNNYFSNQSVGNTVTEGLPCKFDTEQSFTLQDEHHNIFMKRSFLTSPAKSIVDLRANIPDTQNIVGSVEDIRSSHQESPPRVASREKKSERLKMLCNMIYKKNREGWEVCMKAFRVQLALGVLRTNNDSFNVRTVLEVEKHYAKKITGFPPKPAEPNVAKPIPPAIPPPPPSLVSKKSSSQSGTSSARGPGAILGIDSTTSLKGSSVSKEAGSMSKSKERRSVVTKVGEPPSKGLFEDILKESYESFIKDDITKPSS